MKRITLTCLSAMALVCFFAFTANFNVEVDYHKMVDEETRSEYLSSTSSSALKANLQSVYSSVFDEIKQVDLHLGIDQEYDYYYNVFAVKDGELFSQKVLISEEMANREVFPNRTSLGLEETTTVIPCYLKIKLVRPFLFKITCTVDNPKAAICGYSPSGGLCSSNGDIDPILLQD
ncbi:MAG: hypothetical protein AB8G15_16655 [Saprospiraceae bacterium]